MKEVKIEQDQFLSVLGKTQIFHKLDRKYLHEIIDNSKVYEMKEGETIIKAGDSSPHLFVILQGSVNVTADRGDKKGVFICALGSGDVFGEASMFMQHKRTANVLSAGKVLLLQVERKFFLSFLSVHSREGIKILMIMIYSLLKKLHDANQELAFERKVNMEQDELDDLIAKMTSEKKK